MPPVKGWLLLGWEDGGGGGGGSFTPSSLSSLAKGESRDQMPLQPEEVGYMKRKATLVYTTFSKKYFIG